MLGKKCCEKFKCRLVFVMEMECVCCEVEIELMCKIWNNFVIQIRFDMVGCDDVRQGWENPLASP
jgi:hypothetical protein